MLRKFATVKLASVVTTEEDFNQAVSELTTTAARPDVQVQKIVRYNPDFVYARFKAIGSLEVDGPNANADGFSYGEFLDNRPNYGYQSFNGKHAYVEHSSDNINNAIGDLYHSYLNRFDTDKFGRREWHELDDDQRAWVLANRNPHEDGSIEVLMAVDRQLAPKIARMLETGSPTGCSMGTNIDYSECTVCGNRAYVEEQYCPHIKFSKGQYVLVPAQQISDLIKKGTLKPEWLPWILQRSDDIKAVKAAGRKMVYARAFESNYGLSFFELSVVANPAFSRGYKLEKIASLTKPSSQLMPIIHIAGHPVEMLFKISEGYFSEMMGNRTEGDQLLLQRSGEVAKNALVTGNVQEVLIDKSNAQYLISVDIPLTMAETPGFYRLANPEILLDKTFAKMRHRDKLGVVGTVEENFYVCARCGDVFDRKTQKIASTQEVLKFETFSICSDCEKFGVQCEGDVNMTNVKKAEYPTLPTTTEYTGDKEILPGKGAFVGEKEQLYEPWAEKGSKLIEQEKEHRPMGTIFIDPIVAKNDLNARSVRISELSKSAEILLSRVKLAMEAPETFLEEMSKGDKGIGMSMPGMGGPKPGLPGDLPGELSDDLPMGGIAIEIGMTPESAPQILDNTRMDLQLILNDLRQAQELIGARELEASQALKKEIRWSRRFVNSAVKTAESIDILLVDAEAAIDDALMKVNEAVKILDGGEPSEDIGKPKDSNSDSVDKSKPESSDKDKKNKFESKPKSEENSENNKPPEGDDIMAKESKLELTPSNIGILQSLRSVFAEKHSPVQKVAAEEEEEDEKKKDSDEKKKDVDGEKKDDKKPPFFEKKDAAVQKVDKEATAMPPTGARDPGDYGEAGKIESHEMSRWWNDMYPEYMKMKSNEEANELNEPEGKIELLTGFVGNKTPDDPEVGKQTVAPAIFARRFMNAGPKWANSFIGVVKVAEDGSTEAFTASFRDAAGDAGDEEEFTEFSSDDYLDRVLATVKTHGMNEAYYQMNGKVAQLEGITPGKTEKVSPLYDTKEENKHSNTARPGERPDAKDGHGKTAGDKEYYGKAFGDPGYASDLVTANQKIATLSTRIDEMTIEKRASRMAEYALHLARVAASRGIIPFDMPSVQKQATEYINLDDNGLKAVKGHLVALPVVNQRALEAYQIPEAENMSKGIVHNVLDTVDRIREQHVDAENVAPDGIQTAVERDAKVTAEVDEEKIRKQASELNNGIVPQMHASEAAGSINGLPDMSKFFQSTIENRLKRAGAWESHKHLLKSNRRQ